MIGDATLMALVCDELAALHEEAGEEQDGCVVRFQGAWVTLEKEPGRRTWQVTEVHPGNDYEEDE